MKFGARNRTLAHFHGCIENPGVHRVATRFPEFERAREVLSEVVPSDWKQTKPDGPFRTEGFRVVGIVRRGQPTGFALAYPEILRVLECFKDPVESAVFYSLLPGASLHPHRDLSGAWLLGKTLYHVPIETNPSVNFVVAGRRVSMLAGEVWALNTSYLHAVENQGQDDRVHLVVEVEVGDWSRSMLPRRGLRNYAHSAWFMALVAWRGLTQVLTDRDPLRTYSNMWRQLILRLLGRRMHKAPAPVA